jgi:hypothetical protein
MKRMGFVTFDITLVINDNGIDLDYDKINNDKSIEPYIYKKVHYKLLKFIFDNTEKEEPIDWADVEGYRKIDDTHFVLRGCAIGIINRDGTYSI